MRRSRLTPYRAAVLEALRSACNHPTVAEVYRRVRRRRPGVAYATIYNALNWLTRKGLILELKFGDEAARYDPTTMRHDHLICTRCGILADAAVDIPRRLWTRAGRRAHFRVQDYRLELFGLCPTCARKRPGAAAY
jgi:Fur family peroxide stress response transcriptional regulator